VTVHFTKEFLCDLREAKDVRFVDKVLSRTIGDDGSFAADRDDHRYDGIKDGWIRYVTQGKTAYRVIFIRNGSDVYLYRAGGHSIEDRLPPPIDFTGAIPIQAPPAARAAAPAFMIDHSCLLKTCEAKYFSRHIESMYHVRHYEICIVSPFVDLGLLASQHAFGRFLDRAIEEGTTVSLVTASDGNEDKLDEYQKLEERDINCYFFSGLHAKLYLFDVDLASRQRWQKGIESHAILGSSNLTGPGFGFGDSPSNEELNCRIPATLFDEARTFVYRLMQKADDYIKYASKTRRRKPQ
jgi:hypothetical protein